MNGKEFALALVLALAFGCLAGYALHSKQPPIIPFHAQSRERIQERIDGLDSRLLNLELRVNAMDAETPEAIARRMLGDEAIIGEPEGAADDERKSIGITSGDDALSSHHDFAIPTGTYEITREGEWTFLDRIAEGEEGEE